MLGDFKEHKVAADAMRACYFEALNRGDLKNGLTSIEAAKQFTVWTIGWCWCDCEDNDAEKEQYDFLTQIITSIIPEGCIERVETIVQLIMSAYR